MPEIPNQLPNEGDDLIRRMKDLVQNRIDLLRSDVVVLVDPGSLEIGQFDCRTVHFRIAFRPGLLEGLLPERRVTVRYIVVDEFSPPVSGSVELSNRGGEQAVHATFPTPGGGVVTPGSWTRRFTIVADPLNDIVERNEGNNWKTVVGRCLT